MNENIIPTEPVNLENKLSKVQRKIRQFIKGPEKEGENECLDIILYPHKERKIARLSSKIQSAKSNDGTFAIVVGNTGLEVKIRKKTDGLRATADFMPGGYD